FSGGRRHTRSKRDWSSDVCSSDLVDRMAGGVTPIVSRGFHRAARSDHILKVMRVADAAVDVSLVGLAWAMIIKISTGIKARSEKIGRASCREREEVADEGGVRTAK